MVGAQTTAGVEITRIAHASLPFGRYLRRIYARKKKKLELNMRPFFYYATVSQW